MAAVGGFPSRKQGYLPDICGDYLKDDRVILFSVKLLAVVAKKQSIFCTTPFSCSFKLHVAIWNMWPGYLKHKPDFNCSFKLEHCLHSETIEK